MSIEIGFINGFRIVESTSLFKIVNETVKKTWKERLFSFPFRPFEAFKTVSKTVPSNEIMIDKERNIIIIHPCMKNSLLNALQQA